MSRRSLPLLSPSPGSSFRTGSADPSQPATAWPEVAVGDGCVAVLSMVGSEISGPFIVALLAEWRALGRPVQVLWLSRAEARPLSASLQKRVSELAAGPLTHATWPEAARLARPAGSGPWLLITEPGVAVTGAHLTLAVGGSAQLWKGAQRALDGAHDAREAPFWLQHSVWITPDRLGAARQLARSID